MLFYIKQYKNILILMILGGIKMAVKTGVSMISFVITKEMRRKASSNSYKLPKAEQKKIRAYNKMMKEKKRQKKAAYIAALKKSGQYKNRHINNYKPGLISENDRLHELQCKLKERQAASDHKGK